MVSNFPQICDNSLKSLPVKQREIISRRFGLNGKNKETLELIGKDFSITRERVRQIERDGLLKLSAEVEKRPEVFKDLKQYFKRFGHARKEESVLSDLGESQGKSYVSLLLNLAKGFRHFSETEEFHSCWTAGDGIISGVKENISLLQEKIQEKGKPSRLEDLISHTDLNKNILASYLGISKRIQTNPDGFYGLREWPEINPKGIKDKAFLVLKRTQKPLHFTQVATLIPNALSQTVHNELIKDSRFVLVGRGIYALKEWGYDEGVVKDVISKVIREAGKPLKREEIVEKVLNQRIVKENTILLNLSNKKLFQKNPGGFFDINRQTS
ncbi:MAG: sigma factor-like helix-turn-helix DNA-binding protein [Candidatus Pacebacteria bacterium]|nr:sigma factor-like helix-turn-helix DNA-binding protein [Candidatus Paceibacterota bacterium]